ncbi:MAG: hypothetical protein M0P63_15730 [Azoarcus sp.]|nr:hypothetical protein [Azoarcus sp.]
MPAIFESPHVWRYLAAWFVMLLVSIANGMVRDFTYGTQMSPLAAHQVSTVCGMVLLGIVIRFVDRLAPPFCAREAMEVGLFWAALTLAFEFIFFHYVGGHSWVELLANYDVSAGRVWVFLVLWIAVAPSVFFLLRRRS